MYEENEEKTLHLLLFLRLKRNVHKNFCHPVEEFLFANENLNIYIFVFIQV